MHFKSTIAVAAGAAGIASALPVQQDRRDLPLVGGLMSGGGSGLPFVGSLMGSSQVQRYNSPNNNPYEYGTGQNGANAGPGGVFGGIIKKRDEQAKQDLPLVGSFMGGGGGSGSSLPFVGNLMGGGGGGSGLPLVGNLMGGGGSGSGSSLPFVGSLMGSSQTQQYNNAPSQPYSYGNTNTGLGGIFSGLHKRGEDAKQDTESKQHTDCSNQCNSYCSQYFQDQDQEQQCEQQCPLQCSQVLVSPTQGGPQQYGSGQWQPGFGGSGNNPSFPNSGIPGQRLADPINQGLGVPQYPGSDGIPNNQGQRLADPVSQGFGAGAPQYPGSNGIASPFRPNNNGFPQGPGIADPQSNFPPNNNGFPQGPGIADPQSNFPGLADPAGQAFCNIFDNLNGGSGAGAPQSYGQNANQFQPQQSQCPLIQGGQ